MNRTGSTHTKAEKTPENTSTRELKTYLKVTSTDLKTCLLLQIQKQQCKTIRNIKFQTNMLSPKDKYNPLITAQHTKFCSVIDKEFKIAVLKKLNELPKEKYNPTQTIQ